MRASSCAPFSSCAFLSKDSVPGVEWPVPGPLWVSRPGGLLAAPLVPVLVVAREEEVLVPPLAEELRVPQPAVESLAVGRLVGAPLVAELSEEARPAAEAVQELGWKAAERSGEGWMPEAVARLALQLGTVQRPWRGGRRGWRR